MDPFWLKNNFCRIYFYFKIREMIDNDSKKFHKSMVKVSIAIYVLIFIYVFPYAFIIIDVCVADFE